MYSCYIFLLYILVMYLLLNHYCWRVKSPKTTKQLCRKQPGCLVGYQQSTKQPRALLPRKAESTLGCTRRGDSRWREVILPLFRPLVRLHLVCWLQLWVSQQKENINLLEWVQHKAMKAIKGLEHLKDDKRLRKLQLFSLGKRSLNGISSVSINIWREGAKRALRMFSVVPSDRQWAQTDTQKVLYIMKHFFPVRVIKYWYIFFRELVEASSFGDIQKPPGHSLL